jgi:hypothetical protein
MLRTEQKMFDFLPECNFQQMLRQWFIHQSAVKLDTVHYVTLLQLVITPTDLL